MKCRICNKREMSLPWNICKPCALFIVNNWQKGPMWDETGEEE